MSRHDLANVYQQTGRTALAEPEYEKVMARLTSLAAASQAKQPYDGPLLRCRLSRATLYCKTARLARSMELYGEALRTAEALTSANPRRRDYLLAVALSQAGLGTATDMQGEGMAAVAWFDKSIAVLRGRLQKEPDDVEALRGLRDSRAGRARALSRLGRHADAVKECEEALTIDTHLPRDSTRALLALVLGRHGQWARAMAEADEVSGPQKLSDTGLYDLGCLYALKAAAIAADPGLPAAERKPAAEKAAARAVEMLVRAQATGLFDGPTFVKQLAKDADLDPLRNRSDFRKLLAEVESGVKDGAK
jgi:tetratricopeptide (TPR) repeat protein